MSMTMTSILDEFVDAIAERVAEKLGQKTTVEPRPEEKPKKEKAKKKEERKEESPLKITDVRAVLAEMAQNGKGKEAKELIRSYGVKKLTDIDESNYGELLEKARSYDAR